MPSFPAQKRSNTRFHAGLISFAQRKASDYRDLERSCYFVRRGEYLFKPAMRRSAPLGILAPLPKISFAVQRWPYISLFSSRSLRNVAPSSEMPANRPFDRDQERISALISASVWAVAFRPTGPAAAVASAPIVNLLEVSFFIPRSFMISRMTSVEETPI